MPIRRQQRARSGIVHLLHRRLVLVVATAAGFLLVTAAISVGLVPSTTQASDRTAEPASSGSDSRTAGEAGLQRLLAQHDCWSGQAPADMQGQIPGGVVVTTAGAAAPTYGGTVMVARALDHVFSGKHPGLVVHGFCR